MLSSHLNSTLLFGKIVELDKKRNTNREALRALKKEDTSGLKSKQCMFGQSIKFLLAHTESPLHSYFSELSHCPYPSMIKG